MPTLNETLNRLRNNDPTLTHLDLFNNHLSAAGAVALSETLKVTRTLTHLDLFKNNISDAGASALSEALKVNCTLTHLDLYNNSISVAGAVALSEALKVNHTLTSLVLAYNNISDAGASALSEALKVNHTLTSLDLGSNNISAEGIQWLSEALKVNQTLTSLSLYGNHLSADGVRVLSETLKVNQTLTHLYLGYLEYNNLSKSLSQEIEEIANLCQRNQDLQATLFNAVKAGDMRHTQTLLNEGLSVLVSDNEGNSLLHLAILHNKLTLSHFLWIEMTNVHPNPLGLRNKAGKTPLGLAQEKGYGAIEHLLVYGHDKVTQDFQKVATTPHALSIGVEN